MAASALAAPPASRGSVEASVRRPPHWPPMCPLSLPPARPRCSDNHPNHLRGGPSSGFSFKTCVATKKQPTLAATTRHQEKQYNHDRRSLIRNPETFFIWLISYISNRIIEMVSIIIFIIIIIIREGYGYHIGWIFGKIPNSLWPPPPLFSGNYIAICFCKTSEKAPYKGPKSPI